MGSILISLINVFRYQTEGSRGAIKDRSGSGFPSVRLDGYHAPVKVVIR